MDIYSKTNSSSSWASNFLKSIGIEQRHKDVKLNVSKSRTKEIKPNALVTPTTIISTKQINPSVPLSSKKPVNDINPKHNSQMFKELTNKSTMETSEYTKVSSKNSKSQTKLENSVRKTDIEKTVDIASVPNKDTRKTLSLKKDIISTKSTLLTVSDKIQKREKKKEKSTQSLDKVYNPNKKLKIVTETPEGKDNARVEKSNDIKKKIPKSCDSNKHETGQENQKSKRKSSINEHSKIDKYNKCPKASSDSFEKTSIKRSFKETVYKNEYHGPIKPKKPRFKIEEKPSSSQNLHDNHRSEKNNKEYMINTNDSKSSAIDQQMLKTGGCKNKSDVHKKTNFKNSMPDSERIKRVIHEKKQQTAVKSKVQITENFDLNKSSDGIKVNNKEDLRARLSRKNLHHYIKKGPKDSTKMNTKYIIPNKDSRIHVRDNLTITVPNELNEKTKKTHGVKSIKKKRQRSKRFKNIKLVINVICEKPEESSSSCCSDSEDSRVNDNVNLTINKGDLSFLDDFNVDEIVKILNNQEDSNIANKNSNFDQSSFKHDEESLSISKDITSQTNENLQVKLEPQEPMDIENIDNIAKFVEKIRSAVQNLNTPNIPHDQNKNPVQIIEIKDEPCDMSEINKETEECGKEIKAEITINYHEQNKKPWVQTIEIKDEPCDMSNINQGTKECVKDGKAQILINYHEHNKKPVQTIEIKDEPCDMPQGNGCLPASQTQQSDADSDVALALIETEKDCLYKDKLDTLNTSIENRESSKIKQEPSFDETPPIDKNLNKATVDEHYESDDSVKTALLSPLNPKYQNDDIDKETNGTKTNHVNSTLQLKVKETNPKKILDMPCESMKINNTKVTNKHKTKTSEIEVKKPMDSLNFNHLEPLPKLITQNPTKIYAGLCKSISTGQKDSNDGQKYAINCTTIFREANKEYENFFKTTDITLQPLNTEKENVLKNEDVEHKAYVLQDTISSVKKTVTQHHKENTNAGVKTDKLIGNVCWKQEINENVNEINSDNKDYIAEDKQIFYGFNKMLSKHIEERMTRFLRRQYTVISQINQGKFARIYKCKSCKDEKVVVMKVITNTMHRHTHGVLKDKMLTDLQADIPKENLNIVNVINSFAIYKYWGFVMDYYPENLAQVLSESQMPFHIDKLRELSKQLISAVVLLRSKNVVHSDIKPSHILVNKSCDRLKLCGFDNAYYISERVVMPNIGSVNYRAPEIILGYSAGYSIDVWSTALVIYEMATNILLFPGLYDNDMLYKYQCTLGNFPLEMIKNSLFGQNHFSGSRFMRRIGYKGQDIFVKDSFFKSMRLVNSLRRAYYENWSHGRTTLQKDQDIAKVNMLIDALQKMLVLHPNYRLAIEFVCTTKFFH